MKKLFIAAAIASVAVASTRAEIGVVETTGQFSVFASNSSSITTNYLSGIGASQNPRWTNYNFGVFDPSSNSLTFQNFYFENYAWNGGSTPSGGVNNNNWLDGANTAFLTLYRNGTNFWSGNLTQLSSSNNNRFWSVAGGTNVNLLAGANNGFNTLGFIIEWTYNTWTGGSPVLVTQTSTSLGGNDAFYQVIPEPSTYALLTVSALALGGYVIRRRRR